MISVPNAVKNLYHNDHVYKNIRIHFPNGERTDICNNLIVKNSVSFKESLCSQNTLKFGLCESPVFECEVVGVGNIKGATIEVYCEVECSAAVLGAEYKPDLQKYVHTIPYGVFVVNECKRQGDMIHRRIKAYGLTYPKNFNQYSNNVSRHIINKYTVVSTSYMPDVRKLILANLQNIANIPVVSEGTEYGPYRTLQMSINFYSDIMDSYRGQTYSKYRVALSFHYDWFRCYGSGSIPETNLYKIKRNGGVINSNLYDNLNAIMSRYCLNYYKSDMVSGLEYDYIFTIDQIYKYILDGWLRSTGYVQLNSDLAYFYGLNNDNDLYGFRFPNDTQMTVTVARINGIDVPETILSETEIDFMDSIFDNKFVVLDVAGTAVYQTFFKVFSHKIDTTNYYKIDMRDFSLSDYYNYYLEILGLFGRYGRDGKNDFINVRRQFGLKPQSNLYPSGALYPQRVTGGKLLPEDYQSCWYDDAYTKKYGAIVCYFKTIEIVGGESRVIDATYTLYLNGVGEDSDPDTYNTYELKSNGIINGKNAVMENNEIKFVDVTWTSQQIEDICSTIAANLDGVSYMPVDFTGRGLPYVEAGDTFEILTKSNDSITTIVLNRTITGEQTLTDNYKSV